jgi:3-hydroxybutyryl-CoA dehydratase
MNRRVETPGFILGAGVGLPIIFTAHSIPNRCTYLFTVNMMHSANALSFDQLEVGREWVSVVRVISAADIADFGSNTGDDTPTGDLDDEVDAVSNAECAARGLLGPSVATGLATNAPPVRTIAFLAIRDWRFLSPIVAGDAVRIRNRVESISPRGVGRRGEVCWRVQIINQRDEVVQAGFIVTLVEGQAVARRGTRSPGSAQA